MTSEVFDYRTHAVFDAPYFVAKAEKDPLPLLGLIYNLNNGRHGLRDVHINIRPGEPKAGFIRIVDYMGDDVAVEQAARVSYAKGTRKISETRGIIEYLLQHEHTSPFEQAVIKLHVRAPIFVIRQWIRHRTWSPNEQSARYSEMDDYLWLPTADALAPQAKDNKQGRAGMFSMEVSEEIIDVIRNIGEQCNAAYQRLLGNQRAADLATWTADQENARQLRDELVLDEAPMDRDLTQHPDYAGLAREMARIVMPLNSMTELMFTVDLHNLMRFLVLRMDSHAQKEIRDYADVLGAVVRLWCPITWAAFDNALLRGERLTHRQLEVVRILLNGKLRPSDTVVLGKMRGNWVKAGYPTREFDRVVKLIGQPAETTTINDQDDHLKLWHPRPLAVFDRDQIAEASRAGFNLKGTGVVSTPQLRTADGVLSPLSHTQDGRLLRAGRPNEVSTSLGATLEEIQSHPRGLRRDPTAVHMTSVPVSIEPTDDGLLRITPAPRTDSAMVSIDIHGREPRIMRDAAVFVVPPESEQERHTPGWTILHYRHPRLIDQARAAARTGRTGVAIDWHDASPEVRQVLEKQLNEIMRQTGGMASKVYDGEKVAPAAILAKAATPPPDTGDTIARTMDEKADRRDDSFGN